MMEHYSIVRSHHAVDLESKTDAILCLLKNSLWTSSCTPALMSIQQLL